MAEKKQFTIRPFSRPARADFKDAFRICFSASSLLTLKLKPGDLCHIDTGDGVFRTGIAWTSTEKLQETVVQTSKLLQDLYGLKLGDKVDISACADPTPNALDIYVQAVPTGAAEEDLTIEEKDKAHWEWFLGMPLGRAEWLTVGMNFDADLKAQKRRFKVVRIECGGRNESSLFRFFDQSAIHIASPEDLEPTTQDLQTVSFVLDGSIFGGLDRQGHQINRVLRRFGPQGSSVKLPTYYKPPQGVLLYGPKGTGKSLLIECMAKCSWKKVCHIDATGGRESIVTTIQKSFTDATKYQPALIIIDQIESLAPKRSSYEFQSSANTSASLRQGFESIRGSNVLVVAETRHPNEMDESLRAPSRFGVEVDIAVPTANDRLGILRVIRGESPEPSDEALTWLSERTHGYVGADLVALMNLAVEIAEDRAIANIQPTAKEDGNENQEQDVQSIQINDDDLSQALNTIRPTALQEIFLSTPHTPWSSIGGYGNVKQHLQNTVARPLKFPDQMSRLNLRPRKGLLLYGPPGCSKTLLVKALATESGLNFLAVKGAEILSMYVGESERAVREIFRKARAASPSIIFFDEIDAIASARGSGSGGNSGINVLTTLLNELDGIEELKNVLVVAATNTPQTIDSALLRPGRLDHLLYVGPPDLEARQEIISNWFGKSLVSEDLKAPATIHEISTSLEGYSGAEIVGICETAGGYAMDAYEKANQDGNSITAEATFQIERQDIERSIQRARKGITPESVRAFEEWSKGRG